MVRTWRILLVLAIQLPCAHPRRAAIVDELATRLARAHRAECERLRPRREIKPCCCGGCV